MTDKPETLAAVLAEMRCWISFPSECDAQVLAYCSAWPDRIERAVAAMQEELEDWRESVEHAAAEDCYEGQKHCTCVGPLRKQVRDADRWRLVVLAARQTVTTHHGACDCLICRAVHALIEKKEESKP